MKKTVFVLILLFVAAFGAFAQGTSVTKHIPRCPVCVGTGPNLVQNPGFESGGAVGQLTNNVNQWSSLFGGISTADYVDNTFGMTGSRCVAMWARLGNTAGTQVYREGIQGTLSPGIKTNTGNYCVSLNMAKHASSLSAGPVRIVIYGVRTGAFIQHTNSPLSQNNMTLLYPGNPSKIVIASFDVTNLTSSATLFQAVFNSASIPSGGHFDKIIITRSDETSSNADAARYLLIDEVSIRKM